MNNRLKELRKTLGLTQEQFAKRLGLKRQTVAAYEIGKIVPSDSTRLLICHEFSVNDDWLLNGAGDMFVVSDDETADLVSDLLEEPDNEFYHSILELVRTYKQLSPESRETLREFGKMYLENMKNRKN